MARIVKPLTDTQVKKAKPKEKIYKILDGDGLYLEVKPNGAKTFRIKYRCYTNSKIYKNLWHNFHIEKKLNKKLIKKREICKSVYKNNINL